MNISEACRPRTRGSSRCLGIESVRAFLVLTAVVSLFGINPGGRAFAQTVNGLISGTVLDQQHRSVSGATVRVIDQLNTTSQATRTNEDGYFVFTELRPGTYTLSVEKMDSVNSHKATLCFSPPIASPLGP
jgi:hypothetical protein